MTNTYLPGGKAENLVRREFGSYLLDSSIEVAVSKMRELGVTPMMLRQVGE
jgi:hypothetical protein